MKTKSKYYFARNPEELIIRDFKLYHHIQEQRLQLKEQRLQSTYLDLDQDLIFDYNLEDLPNESLKSIIKEKNEEISLNNFLINFNYEMWQEAESKYKLFKEDQTALKATNDFLAHKIDWETLTKTYDKFFPNWNQFPNIGNYEKARKMKEKILEDFLKL